MRALGDAEHLAAAHTAEQHGEGPGVDAAALRGRFVGLAARLGEVGPAPEDGPRVRAHEGQAEAVLADPGGALRARA